MYLNLVFLFCVFPLLWELISQRLDANLAWQNEEFILVGKITSYLQVLQQGILRFHFHREVSGIEVFGDQRKILLRAVRKSGPVTMGLSCRQMIQAV